MYELCPYFTNDGTVGLYSPEDDDIYHSTYGALSESWEKFVIPAHLREYITEHNEVKILDICYGIGYNTKTALNVFLEEVEKKEKKYAEKNKKIKNILKKNPPLNSNNAAIDTDNILVKFSKKNDEKHVEFNEINNDNINCNVALDTDNVQCLNYPRLGHAEIVSASNHLSQLRRFFSKISKLNRSRNEFGMTMNLESSSVHTTCNKILIDAVDSDKILIGLSPFVVDEVKNRFLFRKNIYKPNFQTKKNNDKNKNKLFQIQKMQNSQISQNDQFQILKNEYKLKREVSIILLEKLLENKNNLLNDEILKNVLGEKKYSPYLSKYMMNLARFYSNQGYKCNQSNNKTTFLHNIYYQYLSRSYKIAQEVQKTAQVDLNFHATDARSFIKSTSSTYNFVFLDAFTPSKCPALWTLDFFKLLSSKLDDDGMILTYSNSAAIRNAFLKNGFFVGKIYNPKTNKSTGTVAVKNISLIEHTLSEQDLDLINSKAGICYRDENLDSTNDKITENRNIELGQSDLVSSSKVLKSHKEAQK